MIYGLKRIIKLKKTLRALQGMPAIDITTVYVNWHYTSIVAFRAWAGAYIFTMNDIMLKL